MKTIAAFAVACVFPFSVLAAPQTTVQDDYVWQERFGERMSAAESGDAEAQFNVGEMYEKGSGVPINLQRAFTWFERAAKQNHRKAQFKVAYMHYRGEGTEADPRKAFDLMERLAKAGYARAQYYVGLMHETGAASERDIGQALAWYKRAAANGYSPAVDAMAELRSQIASVSAAEPAPEPKPRAVLPPKKADAPKPVKAPVAAAPETPTADFAAVTPPGVQPPVAASADLAAALPGESARGAEPAPKVEIGATAEPLPKTEPEAIAAVASIQPAIQVMPTTRSLLINGNWMSVNNAPAEFLPSKVTTCENNVSGGLECLSTEITSNIANAQIVYQTRATIAGIQSTGEFRVSYRNNVVKIERAAAATDSGTPAPAAPSISLGWQETEHRLECKLEAGQTVHCVKNQTQKMTLKNQTAL